MYHECKRGRNEMIYVASAKSNDNKAGRAQIVSCFRDGSTTERKSG